MTLVGENRLQDLEAKHERWGDAFTWDFIGAVQSRKVKSLLPLVRLIHSVASDSALRKLEAHGGPDTEVLVEVNLSGEESKGGIAPAELGEFIERSPVRIGGLMTMPPFASDPEASRPYFAQLAQLAGLHGLSSGSRWGPARTGRWRSRRARRSSVSAPRSTADRRKGFFTRPFAGIMWKGEAAQEAKHRSDYGYPRHMAPRPRLLRPRRGPRLRRARPVRARHRHPRTSTSRRLRRTATVSRIGERRRMRDEIDDIFSDDEPARARARCARSAATATDVRVHLVQPHSFNDAQEVADRFKQGVPVILNLQTTEGELAKRLIDFASGLTYALEGGMQKVAEKTFLLTPRNVEVSAEEQARLVEKGFFNQS